MPLAAEWGEWMAVRWKVGVDRGGSTRAVMGDGTWMATWEYCRQPGSEERACTETKSGAGTGSQRLPRE